MIFGYWGASELFICISLKWKIIFKVNIWKWFGYSLGDWEIIFARLEDNDVGLEETCHFKIVFMYVLVYFPYHPISSYNLNLILDVNIFYDT